jgi:hypothetical protein
VIASTSSNSLGLASFGVAGAAVLVSVISAIFAGKSAGAADKSATAALRLADIAEANDRRARTPKLSVMLKSPVTAPGVLVIYWIRNDSPQTLDSVLIYRPLQPDRRIFPIGLTDGPFADGDEPVELGPIAFNDENDSR